MDKIPDGRHGAPDSKQEQLMVLGRGATMQRKAAWDTAKHYTWVQLIIAIAIMYLATMNGTQFKVRAVGVLAGLLVEFVLAVIAFHLVRREAALGRAQLEVFARVSKELGLEDVAGGLEGTAEKSVLALVGGLFRPAKMVSADWYELIFALAAALEAVGFVAMLVFAVLR